MASENDFYQLLGVEKDADDATIRKAFHRKAREYHPDVCKKDNAEELFKEVNEAYDVLSDPDKRSYYDRYHTMDGYGQGGPGGYSDIFGGGFDMSDLFSSFFGGGSGMGQTVRLDGRDMSAVLSITLQEAATGCSKEIAYNRLAPCKSCEGTGLGEGGEVTTCETCHGSGSVVTVQRTILGAMQTRTACPDCQGSGHRVTNPCPECDGQGRNPDRERVNIKVPAGFGDGQQLRVPGFGEAGVRGAASGDLIVTVRIAGDERFQRSGSDLHVRAEISIAQAALGATIEIGGILPDEVVPVEVPAGSQFDDTVTVRGYGMPRLKRDTRGDLIVHLDVVVPTELTEEQRELLVKLAESMDTQVNAKQTPWQRLRSKLG